MNYEIRRRNVVLTDEQRRRHDEIRRQIEAEKPALIREALKHKAERLAIIEAFKLLKGRREAMGLSLGDIAQRSGIDKSYLSKLENDPYPNPTLSTLMRYAEALGGRLELSFLPAA